MSMSPVARRGTVPRGHEGLAVTRALFGAGVWRVECRNSDQGAGELSLHTVTWGPRFKTQVPPLTVEEMELGICCRAPAMPLT